MGVSWNPVAQSSDGEVIKRQRIEEGQEVSSSDYLDEWIGALPVDVLTYFIVEHVGDCRVAHWICVIAAKNLPEGADSPVKNPAIWRDFYKKHFIICILD